MLNHWKRWIFGVLVVCAAYSLLHKKKPLLFLSQAKLLRTHIAAAVGKSLDANVFPREVDINTETGVVHTIADYTLDPNLQAQVEALFKSYQPDYGAFVAVNATTGQILSILSYTRNPSKMGNLALKAIFPAASVFKVVTATAAIDQNKITPDTIIPFNGANHTLYRHNVKDRNTNRFTRYMTIREAFAKSVNTVFAKLGLFVLNPFELEDYANRFKFNKTISTDVPVEAGTFAFTKEDPWAMAEAASGFNRVALMSPLQGAMIAATVANEGNMIEPHLIERLRGTDGKTLYEYTAGPIVSAMKASTATELRTLMRETVQNGTSRKAFRDLTRHKRFADLEIGGKTGSLRGLQPKGKCDWFVGYAIGRDHRIAVAALTVNEDFWRVKSAYLARRFVEDYFRPIPPQIREPALLSAKSR